MDNEMFTCFPNGIRILLVDDDSKFLNSVAIAFSSLNYNVATCRNPTSAVKHMSSGRLKDVDVILADAHKVASCGFNFRTVVENDLRIPVVYFMSAEAPPPAPTGGDEANKLAATVQSSTFIIKKPLDMNEATNLWKVVAWHKFRLNAEKAGGEDVFYGDREGTATAVAGEQGNNRPSTLVRHHDADDHDQGTEEVRGSGRSRDNQAGAGGSQQRSTGEQMNVTAGIRRRHTGSMSRPLEEYHMAKIQKNNTNCSTSSHAAQLPTSNTRSNIPRTDNAGGSRINPTTTTSGDHVSTLFRRWPHVFQEQAGNNGDSANTAAPAVAPPAPLEHQLQPAAIAGPSNVELDTHFTYHGAQVAAATPVPERPCSATAPAIIGDASTALQGDDSRLVASTRLDLGAAPGEAAIELLLLNNSEPSTVPACDMEGAGANTVDKAPLSFLNDDDYMANWDLLTDQDYLHLEEIMGDTDDHLTWTP